MFRQIKSVKTKRTHHTKRHAQGFKATKVSGPIEHEVVTLDRPQVHNAFDDDLIHNLTEYFHNVDTEQTRCVVITGGDGPAFSAGADLNWMKKMVDYSEAENKADSEKLYGLFDAIRNVDCVVIGRVNGHSLGGGCGIVAACDMSFAVKDAMFGFTEVKLGLIPAVISPFVFEKIGHNANRYFLTGERFNAVKAKDIGLVNEAFDSMEDVDAEIGAVLKQLRSSKPNAVKKAKQLIHSICDKPATSPEVKDYVTSAIASVRTSSEGQEGMIIKSV